jgi:hypothetical protein
MEDLVLISLLSKWKHSTPTTDHDCIAVSLISEIKTKARSAQVRFIDWGTTVEDLFKITKPAHTPDQAMSTPMTQGEGNELGNLQAALSRAPCLQD